MRGGLIQDATALEPWRESWDALAVACKRPFCSPAWMLSWWRHAAPADAKLRVAVAVDGDDLAGIAPFFAKRGRGGLVHYRLLASGTGSATEPLGRPGAEREISTTLAAVLAAADPTPDLLSLEWIPSYSPWPALLMDAWPTRVRPWMHVGRSKPAPNLSLNDKGFEQWLAGKSGKLRRELRRVRRQLDGHGAVFRLASSNEELESGLRAFASLHYARWEAHGGSEALNPRVETMLRDAGRELLKEQRFRLWSIEIDRRPISTEIFVCAGGQASSWQGGYDPAWAAQSPSIQAMLAAIEHSWAVGDRQIDFGRGGQPFKYRFADGEDTLQSVALVPPGPRYYRIRARLLATQVGRGVYERLSPDVKQNLKKALKTLSQANARR